jgi:hypothetical protein
LHLQTFACLAATRKMIYPVELAYPSFPTTIVSNSSNRTK